MAKGNNIVVSANPRGVFMEGYVNAALNPGRIVQIDVSEGLDDTGRPDFEAYNVAADGNQRPIAVLLEDSMQGKTAAQAYVSGDRCRVYFPAAGEELNVILDDASGTAALSFGDFLIVDDGTGGVVVSAGTPESEPFQTLEAATPDATQQLIHVMFTGY